MSYDNSMNAAGQGNFDRYIVGDGRTAATALELRYLDDSTRPYIVEEVNKAVADIQPIEITGDVTNAPDEEDLTSENQGGTDVLKFKDKAYNSALYSGLGRVYLRKNIVTLEGTGKNVLTQAMVNTANTIYHIQYDYDLNGQTITLPAGCVLEFDGGSVKNGTITGNNTLIQGRTDLSGVTLSGSFANKSFSLYDAGCTPNDASAASDNATRMLSFIRSLENIKLTLIVPDGNWYFDTPLVFSGDFSLQCEGRLVYKSDANNVISSALTIGSTAKSFSNRHIIKLKQESSYQFTTTIIENVGLRLINASNSNISIAEATNFVYCVIIEANGSGCAYNTLNLGKLGWGNCYCPIKLQPINNDGWINENLFVGGAIHNEGINVYKNNMVGLWVEGSSAHKANNNVFVKPCLEGAKIGVKFVNATQNSVYDMRDEAVSTIQQSTDCKANFISRYSGLVNFQTITTNAFEKFNITRQHVFSARTSFARYKIGSTWYASAVQLDVATLGTNTNVGQNIQLYGLEVYAGKIVDTSNAKCFSVGLKNAGRCVLVCYDANDNVISPSSLSDVITANNISVAIYSTDGHTIYAQSDGTYFDFEFTDAVKKAFIGCNATKSKYIEVYAYTENKYGEFGISTGLNQCNELTTATTINTEVGDVLLNSDGLPAMWDGEKWVASDGYSVGVRHKGTTAQRPTSLLTDSDIGFEYFDLDLQKEIYLSTKQRQVLQLTIPRNGGSVSDRGILLEANTLEGNKLHKFTYSPQQSWGGKIVFRKTNSTADTEDGDITIFPYFHASVMEKEMVTPDPQEYPYIFGSNAFSQAEVITVFTNVLTWVEYDGAVAGVLRHGATADRPAATDIYVGFEYFDETLGKPIYWNGTAWADATGTAV